MRKYVEISLSFCTIIPTVGETTGRIFDLGVLINLFWNVF